MVRWLLALAALALPVLGGCADGEPPAPDPLLVISGPEAFLRLELRDDGERVLWRLVADEPAPLAELVYGEVPAGFRQEVPAGGGRPRPLVNGELLSVESLTPRRVFYHEGFVAGGQRLAIDRWRMELRDPPALDAAAGAPARRTDP